MAFGSLLDLFFILVVARGVQSQLLPDAQFLEYDVTRSDTELGRVGSIEYRLPQNVVPIHFDIDLDVYFDNNIGEREDYTFDGITTIDVQVVEEDVTQITLHENLYQLRSISVFDATGSVVSLNMLNPIVREPLYHFLRINFATPLQNGATYKIIITYTGKINETPLSRGMFKGYFNDDNGNERIYAATHFQPYNARQVFPCFDEPLFKATKNLHLTVPAAYAENTYSNTKIESVQALANGKVRLNFYTTPRMSSYLLTMIISEEFESIAEDNTLSTPLRILARANARGLGDHALELAVKITNHFDDIFDIPYTTMAEHLNNDHAAMPDWASGGTENWGLVSYRELNLLVSYNDTPTNTEQYVATIISHELNHKWFGNWVTCAWWSDTWINEGFASYFGYHGAQAVYPKYELHEHFNARYIAASLLEDSGVNTVPMSNPNVNTPSEVTGHFGTISYSKAASFLRMIHDLVTEETFLAACQIFLKNMQFQAAYPQDLYSAFDEAYRQSNSSSHLTNLNLTALFYSWVDQAGYPVVTVDFNTATGEVLLTQERFFVSATATPTDQIWQLPLTYADGNEITNWDDVQPRILMTSRTASLQVQPGSRWFILNKKQHGHYRVNYDPNSWQRIAEVLTNDRESIHYLSRGGIVEDIFAFMRSGRLEYGNGFQYLKWLDQETNYHVWDPAIIGFTWLRNRLRHLPEEQKTLDDFVLSLMERAIEELGYDVRDEESFTVSYTRQIVLDFACRLGHEECITNAREKFANLKNNGVWVHPYLRRYVFPTAIRHGDASDWEFLQNRLMTSNVMNDDVLMQRALASTVDETLFTRYMEMTLEKIIKPHDKMNAVNYALLGNRESSVLIFNFLRDNYDIMRERYINQLGTVLTNVAAYMPDEEHLHEFEEWLRANEASLPEASTGLSAVTSTRSNMAWGTARAQEIMDAIELAKSSSNSLRTSVCIVMSLFVTALIFK